MRYEFFKGLLEPIRGSAEPVAYSVQNKNPSKLSVHPELALPDLSVGIFLVSTVLLIEPFDSPRETSIENLQHLVNRFIVGRTSIALLPGASN